MHLTKAELDRYRGRLNACKEAAYGYVEARVLDECGGLIVSEAREAAKEIILDAVDAFGMQAQWFASSFYDEVAEAHGIEAGAETFEGLTDPGNVDSCVRYYARRLRSGDLAGFAKDCADRAGFYVWREANACMSMNCEG